MSIADGIVLGIVFLAVISACAWIARRKKQGKVSCGCCPYQGNCSNKSG